MKPFIIAASLALAATWLPAAVAQAPAPAIKIDTSTPENALKSYWAFLDWREQGTADRSAAYLGSPQHTLEITQRNQLMAASRLSYEQQRDEKKTTNVFVREIQSVRLDGENKAVIVAHQKNVTPLDSKFDMKNLSQIQRGLLSMKESGDVFQYELVRQSGGWRVSEILKAGYGGTTAPFYVNPPVPYEAITRWP